MDRVYVESGLTGCTKVSPGCKNCYAESLAKRLQTMHVGGYENAVHRSVGIARQIGSTKTPKITDRLFCKFNE